MSLEHIRKTGQIEHQHHHAFDARRNAELVAGVLEVGAESRGRTASLPCWPGPGRCRSRPAACGHEAAQKLHIGAGHFHVHHEVGAGKAEEDLQVFPRQTRGCIDGELALGGRAGWAGQTALR